MWVTVSRWRRVSGGCGRKSQLIQDNTLCHQHLISTWWWLSKNMLYPQKNLTSQRNELIQQKYAVSAKKTCWAIKMPDDDSTKDSWASNNLLSQQKISWFSTIYCVSNTWLVSTNTWWWLSKNMLYQQKKICQVSEMSWFSKKYDVLAKTCCVIKMPDDTSTKDSWVSKNLLSQQKSADSAKYLVSAIMTACLMLLFLATKLRCVSKSLQVCK